MSKHPLLRLAALFSSLTLVSGYLWYRTAPNRPPPRLPASMFGKLSPQAQAGTTQPATARSKLMPGSKSGHVLNSDDAVIYSDAPATQPLLLMPGSKSAAIIQPRPQAQPAPRQQQSAPNAPNRP